VLALVGLGGYDQQFPAQMSGGEQQRVALARAIVIRPRVLLFDEPLSNLDAKLRVQMRSEIRDLQRRLAITTIYVTHDQEEAMAVSDRIAVMNQGSIVQLGSAEDLYHRPASLFVAQFIGRVNLIAGRVTSKTGSDTVVAALGTSFTLADVPAGVAPGTDVRLLLRPEAVSVVRDPGAPGALHASVTGRTFLGEKVEYLLDCAGETLQVVQASADAANVIAVGDNVGLRIGERALVILRDDER